MSGHKEYVRVIDFNGSTFLRVVISQHYRKKHPEMSDELILRLVELVDGKHHDPVDEADDDGFQYFKIEPLVLEEKPYRLVLVTCATEDYLGVVNAFRVEIKK